MRIFCFPASLRCKPEDCLENDAAQRKIQQFVLVFLLSLFCAFGLKQVIIFLRQECFGVNGL